MLENTLYLSVEHHICLLHETGLKLVCVSYVLDLEK